MTLARPATPVQPDAVSEIRPAARPHQRDHRVDALRGLALLMMLVDHVPDDMVNRITMRNFGFADAAEIFVLLAGYASYLAYGRLIEKSGWRAGIERILGRCVKLYFYQTGMLMLFVWTVRHWRHYQPVPEYILEPELAHGYDWLWRVLTFDALPSYLNILPLYIILLALFPLFYLGLRERPWILFAGSALVWAAANLNPALTLKNWLDPNGWYLDPFGWQFLYVLGILAAAFARDRGGDLPYHPHVRVACYAYIVGAIYVSFPYAYFHVPQLWPWPVPPGEGKTTFAPWRLLDIMAIFYLVQSSSVARRFSDGRIGQALAMLGRHSLEVFALGSVLDLIGRLTFGTFGSSLTLQILVNVVGLGLTFALAIPLDLYRRRKRAAARR
ncbi:OpgC family protein [Tanticharoenia sakaeratensis]|uniref:OpgC protein n=1 Tax=Tanticharoenia sakaeratensis NBRC 103193 TaxID=1231623 RepID=A0A0D6MHK7_9PROT|nr:OpgC domain-containing protein [Tanticharoenia sakaeratensis]GAN52945.1 hypothetical protein Tasa_004_010 [Tanticharoenia sakaeratensis NBRC 103193]GBQ19960.1 hypothetical protein AA103193_1215 [Tanticharoenia sakaeratensis NBRC 103193]